jgi:hypothetical protein
VDPSLLELIENGGLIAVLCIAIHILNKRNDLLTAKVESRYDAELTDVRRRQEECELDRKNLHSQIAAILKDDE